MKHIRHIALIAALASPFAAGEASAQAISNILIPPQTILGNMQGTSSGASALKFCDVAVALSQTGYLIASAPLTCATGVPPTLGTPGNAVVFGPAPNPNVIADAGSPPMLMAPVPAYTLKGNATGSAAPPTDISIATLTSKPAPAANDIILIQDSAAGNAFKRTTVSAIGSVGTVTSIAGNTGAFTLGIGLTNSGNDIRFNSGTIIGSTAGTYATNASIAAHIPADDTIPQSGEGAQIISVSYTPRSATSTLRARFSGQVTCDAIDNFIAAMFNSGTSAFAAQMVTIPSANARTAMAFEGSYAPGSTAAQTIAVRVGCNTANAALNGTPGGRTLGGSSGATLTIEEIAP